MSLPSPGLSITSRHLLLFLSSFSFLECCFTTTVIPKLLAIFLLGRQKFPLLPASHEPLFFLFPGSSCFLPNGRIILGFSTWPFAALYYAGKLSSSEPKDVFPLATALPSFGFSPSWWFQLQSFLSYPSVAPMSFLFCDLGHLINLLVLTSGLLENVGLWPCLFILSTPLIVTMHTATWSPQS